MGYLPGTLWILAGVVFGGAVQDMTVLFLSTRRDGKSLGQMIRTEMGPVAGGLAGVGILAICVILLAVLALVVVNALKSSPWGAFAVFCTVPIALIMGVYSRFVRPGRIAEMSLIGAVLLLAALIYGKTVSETPALAAWFTFSGPQLALIVIGYGFVASVLPVWLLLAPRDYLSTFLKVGTIFLLAIGIIIVRPDLEMPSVTKFIDGIGAGLGGQPVPVPVHHHRLRRGVGLALADLVGDHAEDDRERGPDPLHRLRRMLMESFVAIMAMVAASVIHPGVYFAMNSGAGLIGADPAHAAEVISGWGFTVTPDILNQVAHDVGETDASCRAPAARRRWPSAWPRSSPASSAARRWRASGIISPSCSRRCSSSPPSTPARESAAS